jgi:FkbM family methyltransferase
MGLSSKTIRLIREMLRNLGGLATTVYLFQRFRLWIGIFTSDRFVLWSQESSHPLICRCDSSDLFVFDQIFRGREYRCLDDIDSAGLIVDCGANVGYASTYFLSRFPNATVVSIEPEPENFRALRANVKPYGNRCRPIHSAIWSQKTGLVLSETTYRDGLNWACQVRPVELGEVPQMEALDIGTVLEQSGYERISILKVDVEGAESVIFASNYEHWIGYVDNIVIELHDEEGTAAFMNAISSEAFLVSKCDELIVCKRSPCGTARGEHLSETRA